MLTNSEVSNPPQAGENEGGGGGRGGGGAAIKRPISVLFIGKSNSVLSFRNVCLFFIYNVKHSMFYFSFAHR